MPNLEVNTPDKLRHKYTFIYWKRCLLQVLNFYIQTKLSCFALKQEMQGKGFTVCVHFTYKTSRLPCFFILREKVVAGSFRPKDILQEVCPWGCLNIVNRRCWLLWILFVLQICHNILWELENFNFFPEFLLKKNIY